MGVSWTGVSTLRDISDIAIQLRQSRDAEYQWTPLSFPDGTAVDMACEADRLCGGAAARTADFCALTQLRDRLATMAVRYTGFSGYGHAGMEGWAGLESRMRSGHGAILQGVWTVWVVNLLLATMSCYDGSGLFGT